MAKSALARRSRPGRASEPPAQHRVVAPIIDVAVQDYLARRRPVPHLFDLAPHEDPSVFSPGAIDSPGAAVYARVRMQGDRHTDIRLLVDDGERYTAAADALARNLGCDVYLTPDGAYVRYVLESSTVAGDSWDAIAVDRETGEPTAWRVVRPAGLPPDVPTWFTTVRGRLRQSNGLVSVALPDGIAFATKNTFRDTTALGANMTAGTSRITTVAVNADLGRFEISRFDDTGSLLGGVEFATLVSASLDVIHPDVQLALTWPTDAAACEALNTELMRFADALNRTIWVPAPQGAAFVLPGCGEFAAVDEVGGPSTWRPYPSRLSATFEPRYGTDLDGRLVPRGELVATAFPGVRLVSVPAHQLEHLRAWYERVAPSDELFPLDLAVLADGRLAVLIESGRPVAVGPRELRALLRAAGWRGEDLLLLTQPSPACWSAALRHVQSLAEHLTADIWLAAQGAQVWTEDDGRLAAAPGPTGGRGWHVVSYTQSTGLTGRDEEVRLPRALIAAAKPPARSPAMRPPSAVAAVAGADLVPAALVPAAQVVTGEVVEGAIEPVGVTLARVLGAGGPHAVPWLPATPVVNRRAIELYLWTPLATDEIEAWGLPSADLFLLAGQDPLRISERRRNGYLLRVRAPQETAVELVEHVRDAPAPIRERLVGSGSTHVLPLAWLADVRVTARFDLDGRGGITARTDLDAGALAIRFEGAEHGVPGLPNEVVYWPDKGQRAGVPSYLMLPERPTSPAVHRGFASLTRRKPDLLDGHQLIEVKVRKRKAIDVPATLDSLGGMPVVGRLHDFVGIDLLLPEEDLAEAVVSKIWRYGPTGKVVLDRPTGATLEDVLVGPAMVGG